MEVKFMIESSRQHDNEIGPHYNLQYLTPMEFKQQFRQAPQPAVF